MKASEIVRVKRDIEQLRQFMAQDPHMTPWVKTQLEGITAKLTSEMRSLESNIKSESLKIRVKFSGSTSEESSNGLLLAGVAPSATISELFCLIYDAAEYSYEITSLRNERTGQIYTNVDDTASLSSCGFQSLDTVWLETTTPLKKSETADMKESLPQKSSKSATALGAYQTLPRTNLEAVFLGLHLNVVEVAGFACIAPVESSAATVPGFAPPLKEMPAGKLVPDKWNENKSAITALYKHASRSGKQFSLSVAALTEKQCVATFGVKNGDSVVVDIAIEDIIASLSPLVYEEDALLAKASELYSPFLVQSAPASKTETLPRQPEPYPITGESSRDYGGGLRAVPPSIGGDDFPRSSPLPISPHFPPEGPYGGGNYMGPSHPYFRDPGRSQDPTVPDHFLQPRYDPTFPVGGGPGGFGPQGFPGRGGGRGRGAGRGGRFPGEPDADHLRPPPSNYEHDFYS